MPDLSDKTRYTANLVSDSNLYVDINFDRLGIGTTSPSSKLHVVGDGYFTGVVTATTFIGNITGNVSYAQISGISSYSSVSGIASFANVSGISTYSLISGVSTYSSTSGVSTYSQNSGVSTSVIGGIGSISSLNVSGITTLDGVVISSGIITSTNPGITTIVYYGDGSKLEGINALGQVSVLQDNTDQNQFVPFVVSLGSTATFGATTSFTYNPSSGNLGIGTSAPTSTLHVSGNVLVTGVTTSLSFSSSSDINLKENVKTIENSLNLISKLRGVKFDWKDSGQTSYGVIAQELEEILPELVSNTHPKTVNYNGIIGVLIEAIKQQQIQINNLEKRLNA